MGPGNELSDVDDQFTRLTKKNAKSAWDHACLPPLQFELEQHRTAEFEVREATHPWQFLAIVKGRSGPPLFVSPWQTGPGKLSVHLLELYREKGYENHFAEMVFFVAVWTKDPQEPATVSFRLSLSGGEVIVPTLPVVRTAKRAETEGVPLYAVVLDREAKRLGRDVGGRHRIARPKLRSNSRRTARGSGRRWLAASRPATIGPNSARRGRPIRRSPSSRG